jgi:YtoQ family protein
MNIGRGCYDQIQAGASELDLPIEFSSPVTDHASSDDIGNVLSSDDKPFWKDHQSARINTIRTQTLIESADVVVVRFGDKYKQWNAAFDAGYAAAMGKPYITLHSEDIIHPLKEVDASALAWAQTPEQVVEILKYVTTKK